jgi:hypothetical protein
MKKKTSLFVLMVAGFVLFYGCAKPPTEEMANADAAVARAESDPDVPVYAANTLARAKEALIAMQNEAAEKRYDSAKNYAQEAIIASDKAVSDAKAAVARAKSDCTSAINALKSSLVDTAQAVEAVRGNKSIRLDIPALEVSLASAQASVQEADSLANGGKYRDAVERCQVARASLDDIMGKISSASSVTVNRKNK